MLRDIPIRLVTPLRIASVDNGISQSKVYFYDSMTHRGRNNVVRTMGLVNFLGKSALTHAMKYLLMSWVSVHSSMMSFEVRCNKAVRDYRETTGNNKKEIVYKAEFANIAFWPLEVDPDRHNHDNDLLWKLHENLLARLQDVLAIWPYLRNVFVAD